MRYLLIDAYNIICATDHLRGLVGSGLEAARDQLALEVQSIHDAEGVRVAIVLDSPNPKIEVQHPFGKKTFEYLYAPAEFSADGVIEKIVTRLPKGSEAVVATNDRMIREAARANNALAVTPEELFEWASACSARLSQDAKRRSQKVAKNFRNGLDFDGLF